jgi:osmoprotectant transport system substrate-binding protein
MPQLSFRGHSLPNPSRRRAGAAVLVATTVAVLAAGCSSSKSSSSSSASAATTTSSTAAATTKTVASLLVLGGPPECPQRPFCLPGLQTTYGIKFKDFKTLDSVGSALTYQALTSGQVQIAEVLSSDAQIAADNLVALNDDKHLQSADYVVPVIRKAKATPAVTSAVNAVSAKLTTSELVNLNKSVAIDHKDPQAVADAWLAANGLSTKSSGAAGTSITIAGFNFPESSVLAYAYGDAIKAAGASVTVKSNLGTRETLEPGLMSGQIDMLPEYAATVLLYLDKTASVTGKSGDEVVQLLKPAFAAKGITALDASKALDTNAFAVTKATAQKYGLMNMSDLAKPAP